MSKINNCINIPGPIAPYDSNDTYPTHSAIYGKGGWKSVENMEELSTIPPERLENGCIVRIVNPDGLNNSIEFYYDESIRGTAVPGTITDEIEKKAYALGFRKWTPGYLPTEVSELENDSHYIAEVTGEDGFPINPDTTATSSTILEILRDRDIQSDGEVHKGLYNEIAKAYMYRNTTGSLNNSQINGLVTVQDNGKIDSSIIESSTIFVVILEGFFPDDIDNGNLVNEKDEGGKHPLGMNVGAKYFITGNYPEEDSAFRYKIATATSSSSWIAEQPSKDCIYVNKARNEAYICKDYSTELVCIGRGDIVNELGTGDSESNWLSTDEWAELQEMEEGEEKQRKEYEFREKPLSNGMGFWLKHALINSNNSTIEDFTDKLNQEISNRENADNVIKNYTVNGLKISNNPVITGANANVTGYSKGSNSGAINGSDTINNALAKLENRVDGLTSGEGSVSSLASNLSAHINNKNNPHEVSKNQVTGLKDGDEVIFSKVTAPNGFFQQSDVRLKEDVEPIENNGEINLVQFRWKKKNGKRGYGVIADEVEKNYPSLIEIGEDGYKSVNYIETLTIKISQLEEKIKSLEEEINKLKNK